MVVVGGGAAGLMAAIFAARRLRETSPAGRVLLLEATREGGRKILVSGGGRCNILPGERDLASAAARFVTDSSPNTLRKILLSWPLAEQRRFFERDAAVPLSLEPETGKLFPVSRSAREVRDAIYALARREGVEVRFSTRVLDLAPVAQPPSRAAAPRWRLALAAGAPGAPASLAARSLILATGGLSMPGTGSDGAGLDWARRLGLVVRPTYPALVPLLASPARHAHLAGLSLEVALRADAAGRSHRARGGFLFTHRGYSGPAVLDVSHVAARAFAEGRAASDVEVRVAWSDHPAGAWDADLREPAGRRVISRLRARLPERLAEQLLEEAGIPVDRSQARLAREERRRLVEALAGLRLPVAGDEGYAKAEVTGGGVDLAEIEPQTLAVKRLAGLFLCGELLDACGPIGGYNFAWAWATGRAAGWAAAAPHRAD